MKKNKIFVQIASYRDPQLIPTLEDLFDKAKKPENLVVGIAHQHGDEDEWDSLANYANDKRIKVIDIDYKDSKGACWARNQIQQLYDGEEYTLQLDSHHRFVDNWDTELIKMYKGLKKKGHKKPLLTSYISSFDPDNDPAGRVKVPWAMQFDRFTPEGVIFFLPYYLDNQPEEPVPARFYSAHFAFTTGKFAEEVQHDPELYFHGEEISIAVRAYTHGYDLFHPNKIIAYHEYTRKGRTKHWDNHSGWNEVNKASHERMRKLLGVDGECAPCQRKKLFPKYGLGTERTITDWENYAGIRFNDRAVKQSTLKNELPGQDPDGEFNLKFKHCIDIHGNDFVETDYNFAAVIFEDKDGNELFRKDETNFQAQVNRKDWVNIWREANIKKPYKWIVWAHSESKGWAERKEQLL